MAIQIEEDGNLHNDLPDSTGGIDSWELERAVEPGEAQFTAGLPADVDDSDDDPDSPCDDLDGVGDDVFPDDDYDDVDAEESDEEV